MSETMDTEKISISMADISACVQVIDIVSQRGAFKGAELSSVGTLRDKLAKYIEQNAPKEEEEKKLADVYLTNDEYKIDILTELSEELEDFYTLSQEEQNIILYKRVIHNIRYKNKLEKAKEYHKNVIEYYQLYT